MEKSFLIMGIGNPMLKDDRAGIEVVERIAALFPEAACEVVYGVGFEVLDKIMGYDEVVIIDAAKMGYVPGTVIEASVDDIFSDHQLATSHAVTLGSTLKVGLQLFADEMPAIVRIILIEAEDYFEFTDACSPRVVKAIEKVILRLSKEIDAIASNSHQRLRNRTRVSSQVTM